MQLLLLGTEQHWPMSGRACGCNEVAGVFSHVIRQVTGQKL